MGRQRENLTAKERTIRRLHNLMKRFDKIERAIAKEEEKLGLPRSSQIEAWDDRIDRIWSAKARHGLS